MAAVLVVVLLGVVLGAQEAPPTAGPGQGIALQLQVLLATRWEAGSASPFVQRPFSTSLCSRGHSLAPSPGRPSSAGARAPSAPGRRPDRTWRRWPGSRRPCGLFCAVGARRKTRCGQKQTLAVNLQRPHEVCSPFQVLTELIEVQLPAGLTQTLGDVIHGRLLQPELHQSLVAALKSRSK